MTLVNEIEVNASRAVEHKMAPQRELFEVEISKLLRLTAHSFCTLDFFGTFIHIQRSPNRHGRVKTPPYWHCLVQHLRPRRCSNLQSRR